MTYWCGRTKIHIPFQWYAVWYIVSKPVLFLYNIDRMSTDSSMGKQMRSRTSIVSLIGAYVGFSVHVLLMGKYQRFSMYVLGPLTFVYQ